MIDHTENVLKVCPQCDRETDTLSGVCPHCGGFFTKEAEKEYFRELREADETYRAEQDRARTRGDYIPEYQRPFH